MTISINALRFFHTAKYLRPVQIYGRAAFRIHRPRPRMDGPPPIRPRTGQWVTPTRRQPRILGPDTVRFLNETGSIVSPEGWNDPARNKLWLYNLHYFDDLTADRGRDRANWQMALVDRWIDENPPGEGIGWEPYPLALRIANWIKWALAGTSLEPHWVHSLAVQARWLEQRLEWHLLGNHLLADAKALILAGLFFEGPEAERWFRLGATIYDRELPEQILADGGHFERSPMYHAIILEDLLDVVNAARAYGVADRPTLADLPSRIGPMQSWLAAMTHPDGGIGFFNDAAFGVAPAVAALEAYAGRLGLFAPGPRAGPLTQLPESGYVRIDHGDASAILDLAPLGPDYLLGHGHADTLSFELSVGTDRVIVNGGTSRYGTSAERLRERGTAAHSTVEIDGENSSEVWGSFRVARRARVSGVALASDTDVTTVRAAHDGYRRLPGRPTHERNWRFEAGHLAVTDTIEGSFRSAVARFHFGQGVAAHADAGGRTGTLRTPGGAVLSWRTSTPAKIDDSIWHPEFGLTVPIRCLAVSFSGPRIETEFSW